jgi:hypothetical protein
MKEMRANATTPMAQYHQNTTVEKVQLTGELVGAKNQLVGVKIENVQLLVSWLAQRIKSLLRHANACNSPSTCCTHRLHRKESHEDQSVFFHG